MIFYGNFSDSLLKINKKNLSFNLLLMEVDDVERFEKFTSNKSLHNKFRNDILLHIRAERFLNLKVYKA